MEELAVSEETVKEMQKYYLPKEEYSCYVGCVLLKEGLVQSV